MDFISNACGSCSFYFSIKDFFTLVGAQLRSPFCARPFMLDAKGYTTTTVIQQTAYGLSIGVNTRINHFKFFMKIIVLMITDYNRTMHKLMQ